MKQPLQITFHGMNASKAAEEAARTKAAHLDRFASDNLASGRIEQLEVGTAVQYIADPVAQGPQAKRASLGKHEMGR